MDSTIFLQAEFVDRFVQIMFVSYRSLTLIDMRKEEVLLILELQRMKE